jgi:FkbM family methyltransferase
VTPSATNVRPMLRRALGDLRKSRVTQSVYHRVLWQLYEKQPVFTTGVGDKALRFQTTNRYETIWFYSQLRHGGLHEPPVTNAMAAAARQGTRVFADVGSHLGYYACVVAVTAPQADVVAFELNDALVPVIANNLRLNGRPDPEVVHAAVGAEPGRASYSRGPINPGLKVSFGTPAASSAEAPASVDVITLDEYFAHRPPPDLMKIDVEGAEGQVLRGASKLLGDQRPMLFLEVHPQSLPQFGSSIEEVLSTLWDAGYTIEAFDEHRTVGESLRPVRSGSDTTENGMLRCTPGPR